MLLVGLSGCNEINTTDNDNKENNINNVEEPQLNELDRFIGTWVSEDDNASYHLGKNLIFFSDGTTFLPNSYYEIIDGKLVIVALDFKWIFDYSFSDNDTVLSLAFVSSPNRKTEHIKQ